MTQASAHSGDRFTAITQLMTAIGVGWAISWLVYAADYTRFVRPAHSTRSVFWATALGMFVPTVWLAGLGAAVAGGASGTDPSDLVISAFGIVLVEFLAVRRGRVDVGQLYEPHTRDRNGDVNAGALAALALGVLAGWAWQYGLVAAMQGPLAKTLGNSDFSWLTGGAVAAGAYWLLVVRAERRAAAVASLPVAETA